MFAYISGKITYKTPTHIYLDCNGIAYYINISLNTYAAIEKQESVKLYTHLVVREDAHVLYGFYDLEERELFQKLISVNGVGASTARMILSSLSPTEIKSHINGGNVGALKSVKGIGEKTAQRIILDLTGKLGAIGSEKNNFLVEHNKLKEEALLALVSLGFARNSAEKALDKAIKDDPKDKSVEQLIKDALRNL